MASSPRSTPWCISGAIYPYGLEQWPTTHASLRATSQIFLQNGAWMPLIIWVAELLPFSDRFPMTIVPDRLYSTVATPTSTAFNEPLLSMGKRTAHIPRGGDPPNFAGAAASKATRPKGLPCKWHLFSSQAGKQLISRNTDCYSSA